MLYTSTIPTIPTMETEFIEKILESAAEGVKNLKDTKAYKDLESRKKELRTRKESIEYDIYVNRLDADKTTNLMRIKEMTEVSIKEVDNELKEMESTLNIQLVQKTLTSNLFKEYLNN